MQEKDESSLDCGFLMRNVLLSHIPTAMFPGLLPRALRTLPTLPRHRPLCHFSPPPLNPANLPHLRHLTPLSFPSLTRTMASSSNSQVLFTVAKICILKSRPNLICSLFCPMTSLWFVLTLPQRSTCLGRGNRSTVTISLALPG